MDKLEHNITFLRIHQEIITILSANANESRYSKHVKQKLIGLKEKVTSTITCGDCVTPISK